MELKSAGGAPLKVSVWEKGKQKSVSPTQWTSHYFSILSQFRSEKEQVIEISYRHLATALPFHILKPKKIHPAALTKPKDIKSVQYAAALI